MSYVGMIQNLGVRLISRLSFILLSSERKIFKQFLFSVNSLIISYPALIIIFS